MGGSGKCQRRVGFIKAQGRVVKKNMNKENKKIGAFINRIYNHRTRCGGTHL